MDNNFNNNNQFPQNDYPPQGGQQDFSAQYQNYNNQYQPQQPVQPDYNQYQPQQPVQPDYNQYQPQQPVQPDYNQYQQPVQPDYNQYQQPDYSQNSYQQAYDYNNAATQPAYNMPSTSGPTGAAKVFTIISFVCGILSMITCCYGLFTGIPGLIFALVAKSKFKGKNTLAMLGMIFSIVGMVISVICIIVAIIGGFSNGSSSYTYRY